ncbi:MAG: Gfo/Idh/MocA family oxidoreductase [Planctomycetota bacterium]
MKLRLGVVGVGNAWESRHLPALRTLSDRFQVIGVCDPVYHRAERAAAQLKARPCEGFRSLTERSDIDAVLMLSSEWYGPLPIYAACDASKAIYCGAAIDLHNGEAAKLKQRVDEAGVAFMAEFPCRLSPATLRLKELIATKLGAPRLLFCNRRRTRRTGPKAETSGCERDLAELIDWCRYVAAAEPESLVATAHRPAADAAHHFVSVSLDFAAPEGEQGTKAMISCGDYLTPDLSESLAYRRPADLKVVCDGGVAFVDLPNTVAWFDQAGQHLERLEHERPVGELLLLHFQRAVESLVLKSSNVEDAYQAVRLANRARESAEQGTRLAC